MKIKLFTHTDLDGVGCAIVGKKAFGKLLDVTFCGYSTVDTRIRDFIDSGKYEDYDVVFITDISVNEETAELINNTARFNVQLIDHHKTALWLNEYDWAIVDDTETPLNPEREGRDTVKSSGTSLFYKYLVESGFLTKTASLTDFSEQVRRYDTWEFDTHYNDEHPMLLNRLFGLLGLFRFYDRFKDNHDVTFNGTERTLLELEGEKINNYFKQKRKEVVKKDVQGYSAGVIFAEQYISELGNHLAKEFKDLDFIVILNPSFSVSYRGVRDDIDLSEIANVYGGGGHPKASGSPLTSEVREKLIDTLFVLLLEENKEGD